MTHRRPKTDGVACPKECVGDYHSMMCPESKGQHYTQRATDGVVYDHLSERQKNEMMRDIVDQVKLNPKPPLGITDITAAVDAKLTPVNIINEKFGACQVRCELLHGQWLAECERLKELGQQLSEAAQAEVKRVMGVNDVG